MLIKEFRITMPMSVDEYHIGHLYAVCEASKLETGGGEGIEILKNEPFENQPMLGGKYSTGQYTHKVYHLASKVPKFIRLIMPRGSLEVHEQSWNAYPYCRTVVTNPNYMKENFEVIIASLYVDDDIGELDNVHELPDEILKTREVVHIDIAHDPISASDYKHEEDPKLFTSEKTGRGPLVDLDWKKNTQPVMTCYKLVYAEFKWFGLQGRTENFIQKTEQRIFTNFNRQVFCWIDRWYEITMEEVREIENKAQEELAKQIKEGEVRGMRAD